MSQDILRNKTLNLLAGAILQGACFYLTLRCLGRKCIPDPEAADIFCIRCGRRV